MVCYLFQAHSPVQNNNKPILCLRSFFFHAQAFLQAVTIEVVTRLSNGSGGTFSRQNLSNTVWAFATLDYSGGSQFLSQLAKALTAKAGDCNPQEICNTVWAYAKLRMLSNSHTPHPPPNPNPFLFSHPNDVHNSLYLHCLDCIKNHTYLQNSQGFLQDTNAVEIPSYWLPPCQERDIRLEQSYSASKSNIPCTVGESMYAWLILGILQYSNMDTSFSSCLSKLQHSQSAYQHV